MFDRTSERVRHAISLPNILFGVEEEEIEKLVEDDDGPTLKTETRPKDNAKKEKKRWYNKIPGNLISPLRRSFVKLKRKYDHYDCTDFNSNIEETQDRDSEIAGERFSNDLDMKYSTSVSMENFFDPQQEAKEPAEEKNFDILERHMTVGENFGEHFGEARALAHRRVKVTDILSGRYRKF